MINEALADNPPTRKELVDKIKKLEQENKRLRNEEDTYVEQIKRLVKEIKELKENNKRLESYYEKYCILQEHNDGFMHELEDTKEQRDNLKQKLDDLTKGLRDLKHKVQFTDIDYLEDIDIPSEVDNLLNEKESKV